jgi:hypothetical protein
MLCAWMYKNVTLRPRTVDGKPSCKLLGPDGLPIAAFDAFAHSLRKDPLNTRRAYCRHVAEFLDYLIEAYNVTPDSVVFNMSGAQLDQAVRKALKLAADIRPPSKRHTSDRLCWGRS